MNTLKNARRALPLLFAAAALIAMTDDRKASAQTATPTPVTRWSLADVLIRNTVGAVKHDIEELAEEFPQQLARFAAEVERDEDSLHYAEGEIGVAVEFSYPFGEAKTDRPERAWRVYRLKNGRRLGAWSEVRAGGGARGALLERRVSGVLRAAEAQMLDHLDADTRGSTRDLKAVPFEGRLEEGGRYRAEVTYERRRWEWVTVVPLGMPHHHSGRIEWLNAGRFPNLYSARPQGARVEIVFDVVRKEVLRRAERTWTTSYECLIVGVEGREPPRAEYLTLVAKCRRVRGTMKRNPGAYFTFDVRRVVAGGFAAGEFTIELTSEVGGHALRRAVGGTDIWQREGGCSSSKEIEMTFEVPADARTTGRPGLLQEFRVIE